MSSPLLLCESGCCTNSGISTRKWRDTSLERQRRQSAVLSQTHNKFAEKGSCKWVLCQIKNAVS